MNLIRYYYIHSTSPKLEVSNYRDVIRTNRIIPLTDEWILWRFINNTQAYTNEYIGIDIHHFGNFDGL